LPTWIKAEEDIQNVIALAAGTAEALYARAQQIWDSGDRSAAIDMLTQSLEMKPNFYEAIYPFAHVE